MNNFEDVKSIMHKVDIEAKMRAIDMKTVEEHFMNSNDPFEICTNVKRREWRQFLAGAERSEEVLLRNVYVNGSIYVVKMGRSPEHEAVAGVFNQQFLFAFEDAGEIRYIGSWLNTIVSIANTSFAKSADNAYGPVSVGMPGITQYLTMVVEVGISQNMDSEHGLVVDAWAWSQLPGLRYIVLLDVKWDVQMFSYKLYHIDGLAEGLNEPESEEDDVAISNMEPPVVVSFNTRDLLALTADASLPERVPDEILLDLRRIVYKAYEQRQVQVQVLAQAQVH